MYHKSADLRDLRISLYTYIYIMVYLSLKEKVYLYQRLHKLFYTNGEQDKNINYELQQKLLKDIKKNIDSVKNRINRLEKIAELSYLYENKNE